MIPAQLGAVCIGIGTACIAIYLITGRDAWQEWLRARLRRPQHDQTVRWEDISPSRDVSPTASAELTRSPLGEHMERVLQEINAAELADLEAEYGRPFTTEEAREHWLRESMMQDIAEKIARRTGKMVN